MLTSSLTTSELGMVLRRRRNVIMFAVLAVAPVIVGVALRLSSSGGPDRGLLAEVSGNGLFLGFSALILLTPFFMPLTMAVVAGDSIAGESASGTLRYLLTVPVARGRVLAVKYVSCVVFGLVAAVVVVTSGMVTGSVLFPVGDVTLLSGQTIGLFETAWRGLIMAGYAAMMLAGFQQYGLNTGPMMFADKPEIVCGLIHCPIDALV
jgi:ABC-2 type transport system permease protein